MTDKKLSPTLPELWVAGWNHNDHPPFDTLNYEEIEMFANDQLEKLEKALDKAVDMIYDSTGECPASYDKDFWEHPEGCEKACNNIDQPLKCWKLYLKDKGAK